MSNLTVATFRTWKPAPTDPPDAVIQAAINAAEDAINNDCGRVFALAGTTATDRTFRPLSRASSVLFIHDCTEITSVAEYGSTLATTQWQAEPINGLDLGGSTVPYQSIRRYGNVWRWDSDFGRIVVTAKWGWAALPTPYTEAVKILTSDILDQRALQNGVIGFAEYAGVRVKANPMVSMLLAGLRRSENTLGIA